MAGILFSPLSALPLFPQELIVAVSGFIERENHQTVQNEDNPENVGGIFLPQIEGEMQLINALTC